MVIRTKSVRSTSIPFAVLGAVLSMAILLFTSVTVKNALVSAQSRKTELAKLHADLTRLDGALADSTAYEKNIRYIEHAMPVTYHDVAHAVSGLEAIALDRNVKIELSIDNAAENEPNGLSSIRIEMAVTGTYANQTLFFIDLANLPFFVHVDSMKLDGEGQLSTTVSVRFFTAHL